MIDRTPADREINNNIINSINDLAKILNYRLEKEISEYKRQDLSYIKYSINNLLETLDEYNTNKITNR